MGRNCSTMSSSLGSQLLPPTNRRPAAMDPSPKAQSESLESIRSKLRESLAAALSLVCPLQKKPVEKNVQNDNTQGHFPRPSEAAKPFGSVLDADSCQMQEKVAEDLVSDKCVWNQSHEDGQSSSQLNLINENKRDAANAENLDGQENQPKNLSSDNEISFINNVIMEDELLQGNGLCWASDSVMENTSDKEYRESKRLKIMGEELNEEEHEKLLSCPLSLANKIEIELFKLFGGVNKKYKEKARSLLFNLKDRNNPELRERVMSGEIPPERLCCMTAEELASKELSQWRIAKAEELAQMVVLPDSEVDFRRLVKKTHKGEFQVEVEHDDSVSVEVAVGTSSLPRIPSRSNETETQMPSKSNENESQTLSKTRETEACKGVVVPLKVDSVDGNLPNKEVTLPHDETDAMQGILMDELKDTEFLPPIVSLDEFMESLDSEPPFENLPKDVGQDVSSIFKSSHRLGSMSHASIGGEAVEATQREPTKLEANLKTNSTLKLSSTGGESEINCAGGELKGEPVWEGLIQLHISALATVIGFFKSGEKTSTQDWPSYLEIKGRVRLDAFEKFVQELPMSRSRAVMVVQFCWKEGSPEDGRLHLLEVADSYVADDRVGFAEPAPGMELYLCPPHGKTVGILCTHLPKEHLEALNAVGNGLIGIVVWRKALVSTISPKMSSYQRQNSKKQHSLKKQQIKDSDVNAKLPSHTFEPPPTNPDTVSDDDNDDIPPGFGPGAASGRDEDDLPEFDFRSSSRPQVSRVPLPQNPRDLNVARPQVQASPPTTQMRELVHKYGQGKMSADHVNWQRGQGACLETEPWIDDDEDDIPEWQPHQGTRSRPPQTLLHSFQAPSRLANHNRHPTPMPMQQPPQHQSLASLAMPLPMQLQQHLPFQMGSLPSPHSMPTWRLGSPWPPMHGLSNASIQPCHFGGQPVEERFQRMQGFGIGQNGMDWRPDVPRSRGA